jgi:hypothetical protein
MNRKSKSLIVAAVAAMSVAFAPFVGNAADGDCKNPLDPKYKTEQQKHTDKWMEMHKKIGKSSSEGITEEDYLKIFAEGKPTHPAYKQTKEEWQKLSKTMGIKPGGKMTAEQWQDTTNPLHPCHKF